MPLTAEQVVSNRDACIEFLKKSQKTGQLLTSCMATTPLDFENELRINGAKDDAEIWAVAEGCVLLGTTSWTAHQQAQLELFLSRLENNYMSQIRTSQRPI